LGGEVLTPAVDSRVERADALLRLRVGTGEARSFVRVAVRARQREVLDVIATEPGDQGVQRLALAAQPSYVLTVALRQWSCPDAILRRAA